MGRRPRGGPAGVAILALVTSAAHRLPRSSHVQRGHHPRPLSDPGGRSGGAADDAYLVCLLSLWPPGDIELDPLTLLQRSVSLADDRREVYENILAAIDGDEPVALLGVEPLHGALRHVLLPESRCSNSGYPSRSDPRRRTPA